MVRITWSDAHDIGPGEWIDPDAAAIGAIITTVGMLVRDTGTHLVVTHTLDENGQARGLFAVPKSALKALEYLQP